MSDALPASGEVPVPSGVWPLKEETIGVEAQLGDARPLGLQQ
jgi:hypothetical protein